ncbi:MAG: LutC/YkgG family protein, partial [Chitinophagaceae bacterium]
MNVAPSKENILKRVRNALSQSTPLPFPHAEGQTSVFKKEGEDLSILFAENFSKSGGRFIFCANHEELADNLKALADNNRWKCIYCRELQLVHTLKPFSIPVLNSSVDIVAADAGMTTCEVLVALTGSVVLSAAEPSGRTVSIFPPVHIVVAYSGQLVYDIKNAIAKLKEKYAENMPSMISFQSGPSRTSDIEET